MIPRDAAGFLQAPTTLVRDAHATGLALVPYTFRDENSFQPTDFRTSSDPATYGNAFAEHAAFSAVGTDGVFADNPDTAIEARGELGR